MRGAGEKIVEGLLGIFEFLVVGEEAACLDGEGEVCGGRFPPRVERFGRRQAIKAVVELDRVEVLKVELQHLRGGSFWRIEWSYPMLVVEARRADADVA